MVIGRGSGCGCGGLLLMLLVVSALMSVFGGGGGGGGNDATGGGDFGPGPAAPGTATPSAAEPREDERQRTAQRLGVGDTATVPFGEGGQLEVTLTEVVDPMPYEEQDDVPGDPTPPEGSRYVSLHFDVENTSSEQYFDHLSGNSQLVASDRTLPKEAGLSASDCDDTKPLEARLPAGARLSACDVYLVEEGTDADRYLISSPDGVLAEWNLPASP